MTCPNCGAPVEDARNFCPNCAAPLRAAETRGQFVNAGANDDVQMIDFARIPTEIRAPTAWTIAKGVFLGLFLWSLFAAVVGFVAFTVLLAAGTRSVSNELDRVGSSIDDSGTLSDQDCKDVYLPDDQSGYEECIANN